jgi:hypothetical protein
VATRWVRDEARRFPQGDIVLGRTHVPVATLNAESWIPRGAYFRLGSRRGIVRLSKLFPIVSVIHTRIMIAMGWSGGGSARIGLIC